LAGSVVLLAAFSGVALTQTPDGETPANEGICDDLQGGTPSLFGLCVAFCEAHDCVPDLGAEDPLENCKPASKKIFDKYNARKQPGDPLMPCLTEGDCPCFTAEDLASFVPAPETPTFAACNHTLDSPVGLTLIRASGTPFVAAELIENSAPSKCRYLDTRTNPPTARTFSPLTDEQAQTCRNLLISTIDTSPFCPDDN